MFKNIFIFLPTCCILQLFSAASEVILTQHRADLDKTVEHSVMRERSQNQSQLAAMKVEVEQAKIELAEKKSRMSALLEELEKLRLTARM